MRAPLCGRVHGDGGGPRPLSLRAGHRLLRLPTLCHLDDHRRDERTCPLPPPISDPLPDTRAYGLVERHAALFAWQVEQLEDNMAGFGVHWTEAMEAGVAAIDASYPDPWRMTVRGGG
jgi:hypothetical protein